MADENQSAKPQTIYTGTYLPVDLHARFDAICDTQFRSKSATLLMLVEQYCAHIEAELAKGG